MKRLFLQNIIRSGLLLILLLIASNYSSVLALDPGKELNQYILENWQDELPQNTINAIAQTRDGYIWIGTYEGLARFDGVRFVVFNQNNTANLKSNTILALYQDYSDRLWIGTQNGLTLFKDGIFTSYTTNDGLSNNFIQIIYQDNNNNIWIGTNNGLNLHHDGKFTVYTVKDGLPDNSIRAIYQDKKGNTWIGTQTGLCKYQNNQFISYVNQHGLSNDTVWTIREDSSTGLLIGTSAGAFNQLYSEDFNALNTGNEFANRYINQIFPDRDGNIWFGFESGGLARLSRGKISSFTTKDGLLNNTIKVIFEDREGSLWIGSNGGLNRLRDGKFTFYTTQNGLISNFIRTVFEDRNGNLWIGSDSGGVSRFQDGTFSNITAGLPGDSVRAIHQDNQGNLWFGTNGGVALYKDNHFTNFSTANGLLNNSVRAIYQDAQGNLWFGTNGGLSQYHNGQFTNFTIKNGLSNNVVRALYQDRNGDLWIATQIGLNRYKDGKFVAYTSKDGLANDAIFSFYEDKEGNLWIGTNGGLSRFKNGKFSSYTSKDGLYNDAAFQILEDDRGRLWMSCNKGIYWVNKRDLDDFDNGKIKIISSVGYDKHDGTSSNQCNGATQPAGWKTKDGHLWFPTAKGLIAIDPEHIKTNLIPPPVTIESLFVDNISIDLSTPVSLSPGKERFEFTFSALSLLVPSKVKFKYRLEGFDKSWIDAGNSRTAHYTNIPPGEYQFQVIACNNDGVWNQIGTYYNFTLQTPIWRRWWAFLCYAMIILGTIYLIVRYRLLMLQQRAIFLEEKVSERTKELTESEDRFRKQATELAEMNYQMDQKIAELDSKNNELLVLQKQADRIFSALADALPGTVLNDKYRLEEKIGAGGFGAVFKAVQLGLNRDVAVKVFKPSPGNDSPEAIQRFFLEGLSACRIQHPNAIAILDSGVSTDGIAYLVMELLSGHSLYNELRSKKLFSLRRVSEILKPICDVLVIAHATGIIHRDIKPENIFLHHQDNRQIIKVLDFGLVKLIGDNVGTDFKNLTATGMLLGTPAYMAPEYFSDGICDGRADVYSLGIMAYEMLCGQKPFITDSKSVLELTIKHLTEKAKPLREVNPHIPPEIEVVVMSTIEKDPLKRPTAKEFSKAFMETVSMYADTILDNVNKALLLNRNNDRSSAMDNSQLNITTVRLEDDDGSINIDGTTKVW